MPEIRFDEQLKNKINRNMTSELYLIYNNGLDEFDRLESLLDGNITDEQKISVRNYYVVRIISVLEAFLRNTFIILIDHNQRDYKISIKTDLDGLKQLRKKETEFTNGEIIANSLNFQRLERGKATDPSIYTIFGEVLDGDIYAIMSQNSEFQAIYDTLIDLLHERHRIVHDAQGTVYTIEMLKESRKIFEKFIILFTDARNDIMNTWP